jgi:hypothetical protein
MIKRQLLLYGAVLLIPLFLGGAAWQSSRYSNLEREIHLLEVAQEEWMESNHRLIAGIAVLSSSGRIEGIARDELGLVKKRPQEVLLIQIAR